MYYSLYDLHRSALAPMRVVAGAARQFWSYPYLPPSCAGLARAAVAGAEMLERVTRTYGKPAFAIDSVEFGGETLPVSEETVATLPFCVLRRFSCECGPRQPDLLLVAPLSGHHATLLRDTIRALVPRFRITVTDWVDAKLVPARQGPFGLSDYIDLIMAALRTIGPSTHVIAVCQSSVPVLAATALMAEDGDPCRPASMVLMGGPIDVTVNPTAPNLLAKSQSLEWFERTVITTVPAYYPGAFRRVFPGFVQLSGFLSIHIDRHITSHMDFFNHLILGDGDSAEVHRSFYDEYLSVMDLPAEYYLETLASVFQRHDLPRGSMRWHGRQINPTAIHDTALMTVEGARDDISAPGQTEAAHTLCPDIPTEYRRHLLQAGVGHFGIFNGRRWRQEVAPAVAAFLDSVGG